VAERRCADYAEVSARISDQDRLVFVSAVSVWEIVIKKSLGRLKVPKNFFDVLRDENFEQLDITFGHAQAVGDLPDIHADLIDRLLIAQAKTQGLTLVTSDKQIPPYTVSCVRV
jgi:PIN domain nuclease of toxin-antitoxin system